MKLRFWGTRGSIPTPGERTVRYGGNTACVEVRDRNGTLLVLDAGTGLRELGLALNGDGPVSIDLLLSHLHWDHIQGIPFFRPAFDQRSVLRIHGPRQKRPIKEIIGIGMDDPFFPVDLDGLPARVEVDDLEADVPHTMGPFTVRAARIAHPSPAYAYRVDADGGSVVYATDTEDPHAGGPNPVVALATGAHTLVHDAQYVEGDYKKSWGHSTVNAAIDVAIAAKVKRLVLFHHDPDRSDGDIDEITVAAQRRANERTTGLEVIAAREGLELEV